MSSFKVCQGGGAGDLYGGSRHKPPPPLGEGLACFLWPVTRASPRVGGQEPPPPPPQMFPPHHSCSPRVHHTPLETPNTYGPYLSSNQKLLQMQEYTHVLMQISTGSPPYLPYNAPMPHACKQVLNPCPIETMHIVVLLLALRQSLSTDKAPYHMQAPLVCTIHGANLIIHIMFLHPFGPLVIPTNRGLRVPNPNSRGHATKRGL